MRKVKGMWIASLNPDAMPKLRVNRVYADILSRHRENGGSQLASQLQEARWLIKNVQQRFDTILRVSQAIIDRQKHFFEHGEVAMRPLVLREIAEAVDLHESTIRASPPKIHDDAARSVRAEVLLSAAMSPPAALLVDRHPGADQAVDRCRKRQKPLLTANWPRYSASRESGGAARSPNTANRCKSRRQTCAAHFDRKGF
jgi:hypothetical protein